MIMSPVLVNNTHICRGTVPVLLALQKHKEQADSTPHITRFLIIIKKSKIFQSVLTCLGAEHTVVVRALLPNVMQCFCNVYEADNLTVQLCL